MLLLLGTLSKSKSKSNNTSGYYLNINVPKGNQSCIPMGKDSFHTIFPWIYTFGFCLSSPNLLAWNKVLFSTRVNNIHAVDGYRVCTLEHCTFLKSTVTVCTLEHCTLYIHEVDGYRVCALEHCSSVLCAFMGLHYMYLRSILSLFPELRNAF